MKKVLFIAILLPALFVFGQAEAQKEPSDLATAFFKTYKKDPQRAVREAFASNPWFKKTGPTQVDEVVAEIGRLTMEFVGEYDGYELVETVQAGERLVEETYLVYYERQPLRFVFTLYKVENKWRLQNFYFNDNLGNMLR